MSGAIVELDLIDACRPIDVTCGWVGEASFGDEGLAHVAFSAIFFATAIFVATAILDQRLFSLATAFSGVGDVICTEGHS